MRGEFSNEKRFRFAVGHAVKIRDKEWFDKYPRMENGNIKAWFGTVTPEMLELCGKTARVTLRGWGMMQIDLDGGKSVWADEMFEPLEDKDKKEMESDASAWISHIIYQLREGCHLYGLPYAVILQQMVRGTDACNVYAEHGGDDEHLAGTIRYVIYDTEEGKPYKDAINLKKE